MKKIACILLTAALAAETLPAKAYIPIYDNAGYNEQLGIMTSFSGGISASGNLSISVNGKLSDGSQITFAGWASGVADYSPTSVPPMWQNTENALGKATANDTFDVVVLGDAGSITLTFDAPICNGNGYDFAVFENSLNDTFLEFAFIEVSSDGEHFVRFPNYYLGSEPVGSDTETGGGANDPTYVYNLGSKYMIGYGNGYDLEELNRVAEYISETKGTGECQFTDTYVADFEANYSYLDMGSVSYVKIIDIIGDGKTLDSTGTPIYDAYPTHGSPGFDLSGVGVINAAVPEPNAAAAIFAIAAAAFAAGKLRKKSS